MMADGVVVSVNTGKPKALAYKQKVVQSGIFKTPQEGPVYLAKENFEGTSRRTLCIMAERIKQSACMLVIIFRYGGRNLTGLLSRGHLAKILRSRMFGSRYPYRRCFSNGGSGCAGITAAGALL